MKKKSKDGKSLPRSGNGSVVRNLHPQQTPETESINHNHSNASMQPGRSDGESSEGVVKERAKTKSVKSATSEDGEMGASQDATEEDAKARRVGALPKYGFSFKCDERAEKTMEGVSVSMRGLCVLSFCFLLLPGIARAGTQYIGRVNPGLEGTQMNWIEKNGFFLKSNTSSFAFGFSTIATNDPTKFLLSIVHLGTQTVVWSANTDTPVSNTDKFGFDETGNLFLQKAGTTFWSTETSNKDVSAMELLDSGNLVLVRNDGVVMWQSFGHPTNTLLSGQEFVEGMKLSITGSRNTSYILEIKSGDLVLSAGFKTAQPYWSYLQDHRKILNKNGGKVASALIDSNSWNLYDETHVLLWEFLLTGSDTNSTWVAILGSDGSISFTVLPQTGPASQSSTKIPEDSCSTPEPCDPYMVCSSGNKCKCLQTLNAYPNCSPGVIDSPCKESVDLVSAGDGIDYFALRFVSPSLKFDNLGNCKASCVSNCSCLAMFFQNSTGNCYMFDSVGAFQSSDQSSGYAAFVKVLGKSSSGAGGGGNKKHVPITIAIVVLTVLIILGLVYGGFRYLKAKNKLPEPPEASEEDNFLDSLSGMPVRFSYKDLETATNNFKVKLGQGGFGSVYQGVLPDGTTLAVKKLEGIGQGKKEFRAEVCIIGSIHHHHLVRLRGFCAEGAHRLLVYEFMANGSLDKWIFRKNKEHSLDWDTRFNIAVGTAKGLAYLHEDCDVKIVHCDIKPENVLIDDKFLAKVSDFGLAKLMSREQSHVFTTMRGTRGYLAPEWIMNYAISEKSDVYSYGMVLLEIIGGRKNYDPAETSDKLHFPSYAFKMMEEGRLRDIIDSDLNFDEKDDRVLTAIKVALWCIQEDMYLRPPMTKVVQMLEGLCPVPQPPSSSPLGSRLYASLFKSVSEEGTSSGPSDCNSEAYISAVRLSGPR